MIAKPWNWRRIQLFRGKVKLKNILRGDRNSTIFTFCSANLDYAVASVETVQFNWLPIGRTSSASGGEKRENEKATDEERDPAV